MSKAADPRRSVRPAVAWSVLLGACAPGTAVVPVSASEPPNVLIVLLDDVGVDQLAVYGEWAAQAPTPTLEALAAEGVVFRNAYANPECSPSRAAVTTGRYGRRTGIGSVVYLDDPVWLEPSEVGLAERLAGAGYVSSQVGKWHLGAGSGAPGHPASMGWDWYAGSLENLGTSLEPLDNPGYFRWEKNTNGALSVSETYAVTETTNNALARIATMPEPWLTWVAYNSAHGPYQAPPPALLPEPLPEGAKPIDRYRAMITAMDQEIGRLLSGLTPEVRARTTVLLMGDNGSPSGFAADPIFDPLRSKNTVYEGGVHVPLIVSGHGVAAPGATDVLVHAVDVFATVADLAGVNPGPIDGVSFLDALADPAAAGARTGVWSEKFVPNGHRTEVHSIRTIRDARYKLIRTVHPGVDTFEFFDLDSSDHDEGPDLVAAGMTPEQTAVFDGLVDALASEVAWAAP